MAKTFRIIALLASVIVILPLAALHAQDADREGAAAAPVRAQKVLGRADDAYGRLNKGELINVIGNYGTISDSYLQNVIYNFTWPKSKGAETSRIGSEDATDDFSFIFATSSKKNVQGTGTVIDGYTNYDREDWRGVDGAAGHYHCEVQQQRDYLLAPDGTPMLATSDLPESWPAGWMDDDNQWPGVWHPGPTGPYESLGAADKAMVDSLAGWYDPVHDVWRFWPGKFRIDLQTGKTVPGEFAGDRHAWCIMDDKNNLQGPQVGIIVEMEGICYGRTYAEDFHFYDFTIRNISGTRLDSCYWGYYIDPKFGDVSEEEFYTYNSGINPNDRYNVFIQYDPDGQTVPNRWREIGVFGMAVLRTPKDIGVTEAHFNPDGGANPTNDWELWAQITGNPNDPLAPQPTSAFFHGSDPHLDDFSLSWGKPADYGFLVMSGPFTMEPGEKVKATIVVSAGADRVELMNDKSELEHGDFAKNIAIAQDMSLKNFQGPKGPPAPTLYAVPGDGDIILYWDDTPEHLPDPFSGEIDFEGYKLYRSVDNGATWGKPITDAQGDVVGYVPLAQFDLNNDIQGIDPMNHNNYLGNNSGLRHTYVDSTVDNGIEYVYSITAYDRGDPARNLPSFESARGTSEIESNVVKVVPQSDPIGYQDPLVDIESHADGNGALTVEVIDPPQQTVMYRIAFIDSPATTFDVVKNDQVLITLPMNSSEDLPLADGIRFRLDGDTAFGGINAVTDEHGRKVLGINNPDTTGRWYIESISLIPNTQAPFEALVTNYEVRFTNDSSWASKAGRDPQLADMKVPFSVWNVSLDPPQQVNCIVTGNDYKFDYNDVVILGIMPYTATAAGDTISENWRRDFAYRFIMKAAPGNSNRDMPLEGQKVLFTANRGFKPSDYFLVTIEPVETQPTAEELDRYLADVRVVPNPYVVNAKWETEQNVRRLRFMFLPPVCDISIFTPAGELVAKLQHDDGTGDHEWNLLSQSGQEVAFGLYLYVVQTVDQNGHPHQQTGKFIIIK